MNDTTQDPEDEALFLTESPEGGFEGELERLGLQDVQEILLLLRGDSVVDWHRLAITSDDEVRRLLLVNGLDIDDARDRERLDTLRAQAVHYTRDNLGLRIDDHVAHVVPTLQLPILASAKGRYQRQACLVLKAIHIIYHLDARELRTALSIPESDVFSRVEQSIARLFDELRLSGVPVVEFAWSRKTRDSLITKLLVKRETSAARVFDRLRFRLVVKNPQDILPTLRVMLRRFVPFNYVVPGQTVNTLVDTHVLDAHPSGNHDFSMAVSNESEGLGPNEFSAPAYRILNFVADLPVRVDSITEGPRPTDKGDVVFVLTEFQIVDQERAHQNEQGESSHVAYKLRQHQRVRERLLREPKSWSDKRLWSES